MLPRIIDVFVCAGFQKEKLVGFLDMQRKIILKLSILIIRHKFILTYLKSTIEKQEKGKEKMF